VSPNGLYECLDFDYLRFDSASVGGFVDKAVKAAVREVPGILLSDLLKRTKHVAYRDDIPRRNVPHKRTRDAPTWSAIRQRLRRIGPEKSASRLNGHASCDHKCFDSNRSPAMATPDPL
jgi:hypothetical protein